MYCAQNSARGETEESVSPAVREKMISQSHWLEGEMFGLDELQGEREREL